MPAPVLSIYTSLLSRPKLHTVHTKIRKLLVGLGRGAALLLVVFGLACFGLLLLKPCLFTLFCAGVPGAIMLCTGWATLAAMRKDTHRQKFIRPLALLFNFLVVGIGVFLFATPAYEGAIISEPLGVLFVIAGLLGAAGLLGTPWQTDTRPAAQLQSSSFPQSHS
jgi:uncharacterized membrane protein HdeD (DUF308 family)